MQEVLRDKHRLTGSEIGVRVAPILRSFIHFISFSERGKHEARNQLKSPFLWGRP